MRKKFMYNLFAALALILYLGLSPFSIVSANNSIDGTTVEEKAIANPSWVTPANYLALGDSLAAGMDHLGEMGDGYADYLADSLTKNDLLASFDKRFAVSGYTTANVLKDIQDNVTRDAVEGETKNLHDAIAKAGLITISAGANDVLAHVDIDPETGELKFDEQALQQEIQQVGMNLMKITTMIHEINPDAQVYLMGYYNPFPHLPAEVQPLLEKLLVGLNTAIVAVTQLPNVEMVETAEVVASDYKGHLPNPKNIHLSPAGYTVVAKQFLDKVQSDYHWIPVNAFVADEITTDSVTLQWQTPVTKGQVATYEIFNDDELLTTVEADVHSFKVEGLEDNQNYTFTIAAIDGDGNRSELPLTLKVTTEAVTPLFTDIVEHPAKPAIEMAVALGIFNGYADGTFKPDNSLTRAQAASIFVRALDLSSMEVVTVPFADIADFAGETQSDIQIAYASGIIKGANGSFHPTNEVTRAQFVQMAWRVVEEKIGKDFPVSNTYEQPTDMGDYDLKTVNAISILNELGIITLDEGKFNPNAPASRAFAANLLVKLVNFSAE